MFPNVKFVLIFTSVKLPPALSNHFLCFPYICTCELHIDLKFKMGLSPRMHQTSNNRYNPNGYGSLQVTPIACGLEASKRHGKNTAFLSICILLFLPSININNKDLLKTQLIFNFMHKFLVKTIGIISYC